MWVSKEKGFKPLFNGKDLSGWKVPEGDGGHWKVVDGVIDYDAQSEAKRDKIAATGLKPVWQSPSRPPSLRLDVERTKIHCSEWGKFTTCLP